MSIKKWGAPTEAPSFLQFSSSLLVLTAGPPPPLMPPSRSFPWGGGEALPQPAAPAPHRDLVPGVRLFSPQANPSAELPAQPSPRPRGTGTGPTSCYHGAGSFLPQPGSALQSP